MRAIKWLMVAACTLPALVLAGEQYVCTFGAAIKHKKLDIDKPQAEVVRKSSRYTFIIDDNGSGKYVAMSDGVVVPVQYMRNEQRTIFVEQNSGDNHFIVTVFKGKSQGSTRSALYTLHAWVDERVPDFYMPETAAGRCIVSEAK